MPVPYKSKDEAGLRHPLTMPGKCNFQDSWLAKDIYKDWLVKDIQDIHFARCRACCKSIKLQAMGEAALTSHAGGAGHKAAVRKLLGGNLKLMDAAGQKNRTLNRAEDTKEQVAICLQRVALDRIAGRDWSHPHHSPNTKSTSQSTELHNVTFPAAYFTAPVCEVEDNGSFSAHTPRQEQQQGALFVEQQHQQMKVLEWKNRMKLLTWEQGLVREKRRAVKQKEKAFRMKKAYYKAKLKRLGEDILASSSSSDEEEKTHDLL